MDRIELLSNENIEKIYNEVMVNDFEKTSLKPLKKIFNHKEKGIYFCYALYRENIIVAYAFFAINKSNNDYMLLDYFAVIKEYRRQNIGSNFLTLLKEELKDKIIIAEVENSKYSLDEKDKQIKTNREKFYKKSNFIKSDIESDIFAHDYTLFLLNFNKDKISDNRDIIINNYLSIYKVILSKELYEKSVYVKSKIES